MLYYFDADRSVVKICKIFFFFQTIFKKKKCEEDRECTVNSN